MALKKGLTSAFKKRLISPLKKKTDISIKKTDFNIKKEKLTSAIHNQTSVNMLYHQPTSKRKN